jgi:hypothetical protein
MISHVQYSYNELLSIKEDGFDLTIPDDVISKVQMIAERVGAPGYIKTPVFVKKRKEKVTLKKTEFQTETTCLFDEVKQTIQSLINKISEKTFDTIFEQICEQIDALVTEENKSNERLTSEMNDVGAFIFKIATQNKFFSQLYAKMYKSLMEKYDIFSTILESNFVQFLNYFHNIKYVDPDEDYDGYCKYNTTKEIRKALSSFIVALLQEDVIEEAYVFNVVNELYTQLMSCADDDDMVFVCDEISMNIKIIVTEALNILVQHNDWEVLESKIRKTCEMKSREKPSFTSKSLFCFYDIRDAVDKFQNK